MNGYVIKAETVYFFGISFKEFKIQNAKKNETFLDKNNIRSVTKII